MIYKIDAKDKILGRLATEIVVILRGKNSASFLPHKASSNRVEVANADKLKVSGNKASAKLYWHYTGYPGGIKSESYEMLHQRNPALILRRAVFGMLPKNRLRASMMKNLVIKK